MKQYLVIQLTKVIIRDFKGKYIKLRSCKNKTKTQLTSFNTEDSVFLSNQSLIKTTWSTENYFDKTQNLCFLGRLLKRWRKTFHSPTKNRPTVQNNFVLLADEKNCFFYFFNFYLFIYLFIYLWLCWVFVSVRGLSLVAASGDHSSWRCAGLSL